MAEFKVGDGVQLNLGGPEMTLQTVSYPSPFDKGKVECVWFDGDKKEYGFFVAESVFVVDKAE